MIYFRDIMELTDTEKVVFEYLFQLQESGEVNMFGAPGYIIRQSQFADITLVDACNLVEKWMSNYEVIKAIMKPDVLVFKDECGHEKN